MIWLYLCLGVGIEVTGTFFLKKADGFQNIRFLISMFACYLVSMSVMSYVAKTLPLSTIYPVWTGLGTILVTLISFFIFKEIISASKLFFTALIVIGIVGVYRS